MHLKAKTALIAGMALGAGYASTATAFEPGDWLLKVGASYVNPASDNHLIVSVEPATNATVSFSYMMTDVWAVEVLAAVPFKHDIELLDGSKVGSTKHLPPTVSIQYHFRPTEQFQPYLGIGVNYTNFFSEKTEGLLAGSDLRLGDSWGLAGQAGFDILFDDKWFLNLDIRYAKITTKARLDNESIGKVNVDPWVFGGHIGFRF